MELLRRAPLLDARPASFRTSHRPPADGPARRRSRWFGPLTLACALLASAGCTAVSEDDEDNAPAPMIGRMRPAPPGAETTPGR